MKKSEINIGVIGLGYVGLPLSVEFGKKFVTTGYDINRQRIADLLKGKDDTKELTKKEISAAKYLSFSNQQSDIANANYYVVTVPTPINHRNLPDLKPLKAACKLISGFLKAGDIVIFESTVFPGATQEVCVPILEQSGLVYNTDFFCGYSPERINPGDKSKRLKDITKIVSASNKYSLKKIKYLYESIISAGVYVAESIEVAEAAKVIENTQRDINIALMNELSIIFKKMNLDTQEVLNAANTKWNFLDFKPGLVGGHCIGVDPYYLTFRAKQFMHNPKVILAGRSINNSMPIHIFNDVKNSFQDKGKNLRKKNILFLGLTFKENCPDIRNSKVFQIINLFYDSGSTINVYDPLVKLQQKPKEFKLINDLKDSYYDVVILSVPHREIIKLGITNIKNLLKKDGIFYDVKSYFGKEFSDFRL